MDAVSWQSELQAAVRLAKQIPGEKFGEFQGALLRLWVARVELQQEARLLHAVNGSPAAAACGSDA